MRFWYIDGYHQQINDDMLKGLIKEYVRAFDIQLATPSVINQAYNDLSTDLKFKTYEEMNTDDKIINFQNGILHLDTMELKPHSPEYLCTTQIPCNYKSEQQDTPVFNQFMKDLTALHEDPIATQQFLLEFMAVALSNIRGHLFKKALFMVGKGDSGKSQLKKLTEMLIGKGNYTAIDLNELEARFGTSNLYNKRLAGSNDMSFIKLGELKTFKNATGDDPLFAEF